MELVTTTQRQKGKLVSSVVRTSDLQPEGCGLKPCREQNLFCCAPVFEIIFTKVRVERKRKGHCQPDQHRNSVPIAPEETPEGWDGAHMGFSERRDVNLI